MTPLNFRSLDLNLLRVFDEVMAERSLTRAAHKLSITQPAVSNAMRRLRDIVGDELLVRSGQGVEPTAQVRWALASTPSGGTGSGTTRQVTAVQPAGATQWPSVSCDSGTCPHRTSLTCGVSPHAAPRGASRVGTATSDGRARDISRAGPAAPGATRTS